MDSAGNQSSQASIQFGIDSVVPAAPVLTLGTGAADGVTLAEATQPGGVVTVIGEPDSVIVVEFDGQGGPVRKVVAGNGHAVPVTLTDTDVRQLGDGAVLISARQTDRAGNEQVSAPVTGTLRIDTNPASIAAVRSGSPNGVYALGQSVVI